MNTPSPAGFGLTLLAVLVWGAQLPIAKVAMVDIDGYTMTLVRYFVAAAGLATILAWREGWSRFAADGHGLRVIAAGVIGMAGSGLLVFVGLALTRAEVAVIIIALQPAMTAIAEWITRGARPARFTIACLALAFAGVAVVVKRTSPACLKSPVLPWPLMPLEHSVPSQRVSRPQREPQRPRLSHLGSH